MNKTYNFSEYKKLNAAPDKAEKAKNWGIAIGLQQVDGLTPSAYLIKTAKENIDGKITQQEVYKRLDAYYKTAGGKAQGEEEADRVSARIADVLTDKSFTFAPTMLFSIHNALFHDIYPEIAGKIRKYNITKDEPILNGASVQYGTANIIASTLKYDFDNEKNFDYTGLSKRDKVEHIAKFISSIWQTHPFGEGNTRAIAVFVIKYLRAMGFDAGNEMFEAHSKYFRNALVRANYQNLAKDIAYTNVYINRFFGNLLLGEKNTLNNNDMQIKLKTMKEQFKNWLIAQGKKETTPSGKPSTAYDYANRIESVRKRENFSSFEELAENIDKIILLYDKGGSKEKFGKVSHSAVINALKRFAEFLKAIN